jgi:hypothetical protein
MAMNWLPSLRAIVIFAVLMALFAAAYWACSGRAKIRASLGNPIAQGATPGHGC